MSSKPRKAFDGVARPQGFIDDAAKAVGKIVKSVKGDYKRARQARVIEKFVIDEKMSRLKKPNLRGTQFPKNQSLSPKKFDKFYGKGASKAVAEQTKRNAKKYAK